MKQGVLPIIAAVVMLALGTMMAVSALNRTRRMDERITLRQKDKIPYGTYAANRLLPHLFPQAKVVHEKKAPGNWDTLSIEKSRQALVLITQHFNADEYELARLLEFIRNNNTVLIIANTLSYDARRIFRCSLSAFDDHLFTNAYDDSLRVRLVQPPFAQKNLYVYPGRRYSNFFTEFDTALTQVLGRDERGRANFIRLQAGKGNLLIHLAPLAFSNYFLLHKANSGYFQQVFSLLPPDVTTIAWSEYYLNKPQFEKQRDPSLLRVLFQYPSFRWALLTALLGLGLFVLLEMRRRQRYIPVLTPPKNESLDFVKTIGRLYYDQKDHSNLARKMATYFLEHMRSQYKISTQTLDEGFVTAVHAKTGFAVEEIKDITQAIAYVQAGQAISGEQLGRFYQQLERFYQHT